jgi:MYXO-CTERM domain-containing protein
MRPGVGDGRRLREEGDPEVEVDNRGALLPGDSPSGGTGLSERRDRSSGCACHVPAGSSGFTALVGLAALALIRRWR